MLSYVRRAALALVLASIVAGFTREAFGDEQKPADLGPALEAVRQKFDAPAVAAAVVRDGQIIAAGVSGERSNSSHEPAALGDRSMIGSCGKSATRLLIGRLVDQGKLKWDSTLGDLLPDVKMRDEYKTVTLGNIIGHKGGLQAYEQIGPKITPILFNQTGSPREQRAAFVAHLLMEKPSATPGKKFVYSNAGYGLLGHIAERVADKPYEQLMRDEVFKPLGMTTATIGMPGGTSVPGWVGHSREGKKFEPISHERPGIPAIAPAGLMSMSVEDFGRLAAALVNVEAKKPTSFLGAAAVEQLPELRPGSAGEGELFFGGDGFFTAAFALWPSKGIGIVVQSNAGDSDGLCEALVQAVRDKAAPETRSGDAASGSGEKRRRYGLELMAEADDDSLSVKAVEPGSAAAAGGLQAGDRILAINETPLDKLDEGSRMAAFKASPLKLRVQRGDKTLELTLKLP